MRNLLLALLGLLAACGGGGAGAATADPAPVAPAAPQTQLSVTFPPATSATTDRTITVRGTARSATSVQVNGTTASLVGNDWSARVELVPGTQPLVVVAQGEDGSVVSDTCVITYEGTHFVAPYDVEYDARNDRLIVADEQRRALIAVDLRTGERSVLHQMLDAPEPTTTYQYLKPLAMDEANNAVLVLHANGKIDSVDLDSGAATRIVHGDEAWKVVQPRAIALDPATRTLYIADRDFCTLHSLDLDTGAHAIPSDRSTGGTDLHFRDIFWDAVRERVIIAGTGRAGGAIIRVHMDTGYRSTIGVFAEKPDAMSYDPLTDTAVYVDEPGVRVWDLAAGTSTARQPLGDYARIDSLAVRPGTTMTYVVDGIRDAVYAWDRADGSFTIVSGDRVGDGPAIGAREGEGVLDLAHDGDRTFVAIRNSERYKFTYPTWFYDDQYAILAVDGRTGDRTVVAADPSERGQAALLDTRGDGEALGRPVSIAVDGQTGDLVVLDGKSSTLLRVDAASGDRELIAHDAAGSWVSMVVDAATRRALVRTDVDTLVQVDLDTGAIATLPHGLPAGVTDMALVPGGEQVVLAGATPDAVVRLDLATGALEKLDTNGPVLDLCADPATGRVLALCANGILAIDTFAAALPQDTGIFPLEPVELVADPRTACVVVGTSGTRADLRGLFAVDPATGASVVASKD